MIVNVLEPKSGVLLEIKTQNWIQFNGIIPKKPLAVANR